ncbi:group 1 glycosyl transferase [Niastella yeongjuensis]|uniref:Group 1 glycosyl transferase n=1 Tax=Niastella yeongjuensis TaxID=354355 RepID=A0A1V9F354_9BACT|nr:glycosyltransferase [Niastella yeongjuensis]OQP52843.1 group 1 glycosyl transferase [Niastella yeongjuensis]SEP20957.1 Glycosyltransferase involved in cell wall bisynthesis [Niastella yeongjuensis]
MARFLFIDEKIINLMQVNEKPTGGSSVQTYGWILGLIAEGQEVQVMTRIDSKTVLKEECKNIKIVPMYDFNKGIRWFRWIYYRLPHMYKKIKRAKPDYLYSGIAGWTTLLLTMTCRILHVKYIQRISSDAHLDKRYRDTYSAIQHFILYWGLRMSHHILCQNNYQLLKIKKKFPNKSAIKILNPHYLDHQELPANEHASGYIAWLGLYRYPKNLKLLFQVASLLKKEQFWIAGKAGSNSDEETTTYLEKLKKLPNVHFPGFLERTQVLPFLAKAKFLLNTSRFEGFSNTFLESWAVGTPVMSTVNVNPDSIISNHQLGIVYTDVFDLSRQHATLTKEQYQLMSENARQYVTHYHGYRIVTQQLLTYLSKTDKPITSSSYLNAPA